MSLGMKRGFLGKKGARRGNLTRIRSSSHQASAENADRGIFNFQLSETCRTHSENPLIIEADHRHGQAPEASHFLYVPHTRGDAAIVILDHLHNLQRMSQWDIWKHPPPAPGPPSPPYVLEQSLDKGMKMVARRPIAMGELIASERPLVVSRIDVAIAEDQSTTGVFYQAALSGLSPAIVSRIMSLHNSFGPEQETILGRLLTNYQPVTIPDVPDTEYSGLFTILCRANHDCSPNANFFFNSRTFTGQFHAVRAIAEGEEITALYCELAASRQERRAELREHYNFLCECSTCSLPPDLAEQSDVRRKAIKEIIPMMHAGIYADDMSVARIEELLGWATEEGLYALYAEILVYGFGLASKVGAAELARKWSQMAATAFQVLRRL
ncbi:hypothetical protein K438DRAFT_1854322 [Mycena galopus ATCC 62051]|nr:hypothetical protein K438DRAFT_1854322 [Mycena galopus ATCC 62051]